MTQLFRQKVTNITKDRFSSAGLKLELEEAIKADMASIYAIEKVSFFSCRKTERYKRMQALSQRAMSKEMDLKRFMER